MKELKLYCLGFVAMMFVQSACAAEWFVDKSRLNDDGDGTSVEN